MPFPRKENYVRKLFDTLLPASNERESESGHAILRTSHAVASSRFGVASRVRRAQEAAKNKQKNKLGTSPSEG